MNQQALGTEIVNIIATGTERGENEGEEGKVHSSFDIL